MLTRISWLCAAVVGLGLSLGTTRAEEINDLMAQAKYAEAEAKLTQKLAQGPDDLAQMQLGVVRALVAIQTMANDSFRYGAYAPGLPMVAPGGIRVNQNHEPAKMTYDDARALIDRFRAKLLEAEEALAKFQNPDVKWLVRFDQIALDVDGDGQIGDHEHLLAPFQSVPAGGGAPVGADQMSVAIDEADVAWLRGYCHATAGTCDAILAHDFKDFFELTGHTLFRGAQTRFEFLKPYDESRWEIFPDIIAAIHLMNFKVAEPERMKAAHAHFVRTIEMSRQMWTLALAESDDDHEWIASPTQKQTLPLPGMSLTEEQWNEWPKVLDEAEALLAGKKLLPLWRAPQPDQGVNLKKVFFEPQTFDLVMWVHQSGAMPFVEKGEVTDAETWQRLNRVFRGNLVGYAFWLN